MHHTLAWLVVPAVLASASIGCSSGSGSANPNGGMGQTGNFSCKSGCDKVAAAHCPNWSFASASECTQDCEQLFQSLSSSCKNTVADYETCLVSGAVSCSANGTPTTTSQAQCQAKLDAALPCLQAATGNSSGGGGSAGSSSGGPAPAPGG